MLDAYLFDEDHGKKIEAWADALDDLDQSQMLWLDLLEPSAEEAREVGEALGLDGLEPGRFHEEAVQPAFGQSQEYLRVTALAASDTEDDAAPQTVAVDSFVGKNWVLTAHSTDLAVIEDFRDRAEGEGNIGILDAPSFLAVLMEWVVTSYLRAFDTVEAELEEFDIRVLRSTRRDAERQISALVEVRRRVGRLRRSLAPHREIFVALSDSEFDPVSTEESAKRFGELAAKTETALLPHATRRMRSSARSMC